MISLATSLLIGGITGAVTMTIGYMIGKARGKMYLKMAYDLADRTQKQVEILREAFVGLVDFEEDDE